MKPRALRDLTKQYLGITIQEGEHDPVSILNISLVDQTGYNLFDTVFFCLQRELMLRWQCYSTDAKGKLGKNPYDSELKKRKNFLSKKRKHFSKAFKTGRQRHQKFKRLYPRKRRTKRRKLLCSTNARK